LFIINPLSGHGVDSLFATHPSTQNRIAALQQLAIELGASGATARVAGPDDSARSPLSRPSRGPWG